MTRNTVILLLQQLGFDTYTKNRVLRGDSIFINHDAVSTRKERFKSSEAVSRTSSVDFRINKTNRLVVFSYSSSTSSTNKFQVPSTATNAGIKITGVILEKVILNRNSKENCSGGCKI